jgi:hypothetical protein
MTGLPTRFYNGREAAENAGDGPAQGHVEALSEVQA